MVSSCASDKDFSCERSMCRALAVCIHMGMQFAPTVNTYAHGPLLSTNCRSVYTAHKTEIVVFFLSYLKFLALRLPPLATICLVLLIYL